jgi:hypothetical protein
MRVAHRRPAVGGFQSQSIRPNQQIETKLNIPLKKVLASGLGVAGLVLGSSTPAHSFDQVWVHGINTQTYFAPGPPPGPELSLCQVKTQLYKTPFPGQDGVKLLLNPLPKSQYTACTWGSTQVVAVHQEANGSWTLWAGNWNDVLLTNLTGDPMGAGGTSPKAYALLGGNFKIENAWGYQVSWQANVW